MTKDLLVTDTVSGYVVVLSEDLDGENAENVLAQLRAVRGVSTIESVPADNLAEMIGRTRANAEWQNRILAMLGTTLLTPADSPSEGDPRL